MKDKFATYHPIVNFIYFAVILILPMFCLHPVIIGIAFCSGVSYTICQKGIRQFVRMLPWMLVIFCLSAVINPLFNRLGATKLFLFPNGNAVTLESVLYGLSAGVMLMGIILWFGCFHKIMTGEKLMQLFGKRIPAVSLLFTITLRFVPKFAEQIKLVSDAQRGAGLGTFRKAGKLRDRIHQGLKILSITITWAFEHSIETADSMRSRGYGLKQRTVYVRMRFDARDGWMLGVIGGLSSVLFLTAASGGFYIRYYPQIELNENTWLTTAAYISYGILAFIPVILQGMEEIIWKYLRSRI